jgi:DNA (cytosine-5)-methyltransferase 1
MSRAIRPPSGEKGLADANGKGQLQPQGPEQQEWRWTGDGRLEIPNTDGGDAQGLFGWSAHEEGRSEPGERSVGLPGRGLWPNWPPEPGVCRVAHGVAYRVDRTTALGNGQVPRVAAAAWRLLVARSGLIVTADLAKW